MIKSSFVSENRCLNNLFFDVKYIIIKQRGDSVEYAMTFFEGMVSFISPCFLPLLPIYISYFAGRTNKKAATFFNALSFVIGFTVIFCMLGLFAGSLGSLLNSYHEEIELISGIIIVLLGLNFLGVINIPFLKGFHASHNVTGMFSALIFGAVFAISHAPCMSAFLGTALVTASASGSVVKGFIMLLSYSLGLGIPFLLSAVLIEKLDRAFEFIKKNYKVINFVCGLLLILIGVCMATGLFHEFLHLVL